MILKFGENIIDLGNCVIIFLHSKFSDFYQNYVPVKIKYSKGARESYLSISNLQSVARLRKNNSSKTFSKKIRNFTCEKLT